MKMGFVKGRAKTGGRKPGSQNRNTVRIQKFIERLITDNLQDLKWEFRELPGKDKFTVLSQLLKFVIPAQQSGEMNINLEKLDDESLDKLYQKILSGETEAA